VHEDEQVSEDSAPDVVEKIARLEPHSFRTSPFVFGLAFAAVGVVGAAGFESDAATAWLWVVALTVFGIAGVAAALGRR
jgi:hypothetical protein